LVSDLAKEKKEPVKLCKRPLSKMALLKMVHQITKIKNELVNKKLKFDEKTKLTKL